MFSMGKKTIRPLGNLKISEQDDWVVPGVGRDRTDTCVVFQRFWCS